MGGRRGRRRDGGDDCGKIHAALTLTRVTRIGQGHTHTEQNQQTFTSLTASERDSEK